MAAPKLIDAESAVERAIRLCQGGASAPDAAVSVYRSGLSPEAIASFAISGLISRIHTALGDLRTTAFSGSEAGRRLAIDGPGGLAPAGRRQRVGVNPIKAFWEQALSARYSTPDGMKALLDFTLGDTRSLLSRAENQVAGWRKVREATRLAERLMVQRKVDFLRDLPPDEKAAIAEALR